MKSEFKFISPHEAIIEKTKKNYEFIMSKVKEYPEIKNIVDLKEAVESMEDD